MDIFGDDFNKPATEPASDFTALARDQFQLAGFGEVLKPEIASPVFNCKTNGYSTENEVDLLLDLEVPKSTVADQELNKLTLWKEEQKKRLAEKDAEEERNKTELLKTAKRELEDWYKAHNERVAKTKAANRSAEKACKQSSSSVQLGNEWAQVAEMCDFGARRGQNTGRMRSLILHLKQSGDRPKYPPRNNSHES